MKKKDEILFRNCGWDKLCEICGTYGITNPSLLCSLPSNIRIFNLKITMQTQSPFAFCVRLTAVHLKNMSVKLQLFDSLCWVAFWQKFVNFEDWLVFTFLLARISSDPRNLFVGTFPSSPSSPSPSSTNFKKAYLSWFLFVFSTKVQASL